MFTDLDPEIVQILNRIAEAEARAFPDSELLAYEDRFNTEEGLCIYCGCEEEPENHTVEDIGYCNCDPP